MNKITNFLCLSILLLGATALGMNSPEAQLIEAAKNGNLEKVQGLIAQGASIEAKDKSRMTPLIWAAFNGHENVCRLLVANKASIEAKDFVGSTPLHFAVEFGHEDVCRLLIENKASIYGVENGYTYLHRAASGGHEGICRLLIENKASVDTKTINYEETPLHNAAGRGHEGICRLLIKNKASVDVKHAGGCSPLMSAASHKGDATGRGHSPVCRLLIDIQLEQARIYKTAIATFLGISRKRAANLPCQMQKEIAQLIARQAFEYVQQDKQRVIAQVNPPNISFWDNRKTKGELLAYVNQRFNEPWQQPEQQLEPETQGLTQEEVDNIIGKWEL
jgi:hypothetical protein